MAHTGSPVEYTVPSKAERSSLGLDRINRKPKYYVPSVRRLVQTARPPLGKAACGGSEGLHSVVAFPPSSESVSASHHFNVPASRGGCTYPNVPLLLATPWWYPIIFDSLLPSGAVPGTESVIVTVDGSDPAPPPPRPPP